MSLFSTLQTGASGLGVSGQSLGVIGDNIANLNTVGFKRSQANFADLLPQDVSGLGGVSQMGRGATAMRIGAQFSQGALSNSGSPLDMALSGAGWFQVNDGENAFFTRDGSFGLDNQGYMVNGLGHRVQGYSADGGALSPVVGDLRLGDEPVPPQATENITFDVVLDSGSSNGVDYNALVLDGASVSIEEASEAADFATSFTVYDSLGRPHDVVLNFEQDPTDPNVWTYSAVIDGGDTDVAGATAGSAFEIGRGTLSFDTSGELTTNAFTPTATAWTWPGAAAWAPTFQVGLDPSGASTDGSVLNSGAGTGNALTSIQQDGYAMGDLTSVSVNENGEILGQYSNGQNQVLGQVAVATFDAESGLRRAGGNLFQSTLASGDPAIGRPNGGGRGRVVGFALERSNVDLEDEFVNMIQAQRTYQANAGVVRTADETLQELVNLI